MTDRTILDVLRRRVADQGDRTAYAFLESDETQESRLSWSELHARACAVAERLRRDADVGDRALLFYPPGLDYIVAFFGCLEAGIVAVPAYPPLRQRGLPRLDSIARDSDAKLALTSSDLVARSDEMVAHAVGLERVTWLDVAGEARDIDVSSAWTSPNLDENHVAFLQYTSGSTGDPKGVMVTHGNLLANEDMIQDAFGLTGDDVIVGWLPLYHDMGLIGNVFQTLHLGATCVLMAPVAFLQRPLRWLEAISRFGATGSGGPDFAYDLCVRKVTPEQKAGLDLSKWRVAFNGAEPVRAATLDRFAETFADCGFRRDAFQPCYGLAESTLMVTGGRTSQAVPEAIVDEGGLEAGQIEYVDAGDIDDNKATDKTAGRRLIGSGELTLSAALAVVDPKTRERVAADRVGEVWVSGPHVADGYWRNDDATEETFRAHIVGGDDTRWLRTGDLGFAGRDGQLYVTGRIKDLIIIRGRNLYPHDIEAAAQAAHPGAGAGATFAVETPDGEGLVVVCEVEREHRRAADEVVQTVRVAVANEFDVTPEAVVLIKPGRLPRTSSGKVRRRATKAAFEAGELDVVSRWSLRSRGTSATSERFDYSNVDPVVRDMADIVAEQVGLEREDIDPSAAVIDLGVDSLRATEILHAVEQRTGKTCPLVTLLEGASLVEIAERLEIRETKSAAEEWTERRLTRGERALWFLHRLEPTSSAYNIARAVRVKGQAGSVDVDALRRAFEIVVERHDGFRIAFTERGDEPIAIRHDDAPLDFEIVEDAGDSDDAFRARITAQAERPFVLAAAPPIRVRLFERRDAAPVLLFVAHHIAVDLWSLALAMEEFGRIYQGQVAGADVELEPAHNGASFVAREEEFLDRASTEELLDDWRRDLRGPLPILDLATDHPRAAEPKGRGRVHMFSVDADVAAPLRALASSQNTTSFNVLLAAFQVLLSRLTGQTDVIVGAPIANRSDDDDRERVRYAVNAMPLRAQVASDQSFRAFVRQTRDTTLRAIGRARYPFPTLVEKLQPEREVGRTPIFQVMFAFERAPRLQGDVTPLVLGSDGGSLDVGGLELSSFALTERGAPFDFYLTFADDGDRLSAAWHYDADLFDAETMTRMGERMRRLLAEIAADPQANVGTLDVVPEAEREFLLREANQTERPLPDRAVLPEMVDEQIRRVPDRVAVVSSDRSLSYRDLDLEVEGFARLMVRAGVKVGDRVAVCLDRGPRLVAALLAVMRTGATYIPLDPSYPSERIRHVLDDSEAVAVVAEQSTLEALPAERPNTLIAEDVVAVTDDDRVRETVDPASPAYVIYTSGSTGRPKGVVVPHRALANFLLSMQREPGVREGDVLCAVTTISFDIAGLELYVPLITGAAVAVADRDVVADGERLRDFVVATNTTVMQATPVTWTLLLEAGWSPARSFRVLCGGEAFPLDLARRLTATVDEVWNMYGPTETTIWSTVKRVPSNPERVTIGHPIDNTRVYVLDAEMRPVPRGVVGELWIGGVGVADGYWNRVDLTAERFQPDPFAAPGDAATWIYRTGDRVRWRDGDGTDGHGTDLECLGRVDDQVKIRGFRIEPGEIEAALGRHPSVGEAVVTTFRVGGDLRLAGYVTPNVADDASSTRNSNQSAMPEPADLRAYLRDHVPDYMVPATIVVMESLPRTPNGKIDRKALPEPLSAMPRGEIVAPRNETESVIVEVYRGLLGVEGVGVHDDFFELGGHSLLATQAASRLRGRVGVEVPVRWFFESPTAAELAERVDTAAKDSVVTEVPMTARGVDGDQPLSFGQERLWFIDQMEPGSSVYNIAGGLRFRGTLDRDALAGALSDIVARHETLRSVIVRGPMGAVQQPREETGVSLETIEVTGGTESELERLTIEEAKRPFDLAQGPLLRAKLFRLADDHHVACFVVHHVMADGWSVGVLIDEIATAYGQRIGGHDAAEALPELPIQYSDYSAWQREHLQGEPLDRLTAYWRENLAGIPKALDFPTDHARPAEMSNRGARLDFRIDGVLRERLETVGRRHGATLYMTLLTAYKTLLHRYTGEEDIVTGSPIANRQRAEIEGLIGFFVNSIALRGDLSGDPKFSELLRRIRETTLGAYAHQDLPFERLVEELRPERELNRTPIFQTLFILQNTPSSSFDVGGLDVDRYDIDNGTAKFDLQFEITMRGDDLGCAIFYASDLFERETIERLGAHWLALLTEVAENPDRSLSDYEIIGIGERTRVLEDFATTGPANAPASLPEMVRGAAAKDPSRTALVFEGETVSYDDLVSRVDAVAKGLIEIGIGAGDRVGLLIDRSPKSVISALGIMRAGAAYVALDASHPAPRLRGMVEATSIGCLIADAGRAAVAASLGVTVVDVDDVVGQGAASSSALPEVDLDAEAYVVFTSGSTGVPKAVPETHRGAANYLTWLGRTFELTTDDTVVQLPALTFDASVKDTFGALAHGASLVLLRTDENQNPSAVLEAMRRHDATRILSVVPTFLSALADAAAGSEPMPHLTTILSSGEALRHALGDRLRATFGSQVRIFNLYGPTECTITTTVAEAVRGGPDEVFVSAGRPIPGARVYVLDPAGRPTPIGVPGEIHIGGVGVATGYLNAAEEAARCFVPDLFVSESQAPARMYRTGDVGRFRPDGALVYLGRLDDQLKLHGLRIEPGEIAHVLGEVDDVRDAVVVARPDASGGSRLVGYVVAQAGRTVVEGDLRRALLERLPMSHVPSAIAVIAEIPRKPNGKVDRARLPEPDTRVAVDDDDYVAPETKMEKRMAAWWAEVLDTDRIGVHDNFFDLGGHSLLSIELITKIEQEVGVRLGPRDIMLQTLRQLAASVDEQSGGSGGGFWSKLFGRKSRRPTGVRGA